MKQLLIAAILIGGFTIPAYAMGPFYIVFDKGTNTCSMVDAPPSDTEKFAMMGTYKTEEDAHRAMETMADCN